MMIFPARHRLLGWILLLWIITPAFLAQAQDWTTFYERSGGKETPRYEETLEYCRQLDEHSPWIQLSYFGTSPQGRGLPVLIADRGEAFRPGPDKRKKAVVMVQACIHPGESEGKDAGLMLLRDIAITRELDHLLDSITLIFIPIFNVDGHERWGSHNRINQNGPEEMGWRTTASNLNLNRDYLKADAPEMQAWLRLFNTWMPDLFIDCHTSDGADYQYTMTYALETFGNMDPGLTQWQKERFLPYLKGAMDSIGSPIQLYVSFREWFNPLSGMRHGASPPMLSQGYTAQRNRPGLLLETHMLKPYKPRVEATYDMLKFSLEAVNRDRRQLRELVDAADALTASPAFRASDLVVDWGIDYSDSTWIDFLGVGWEAEPSDLTGGTWFKYTQGPKTLKMKLFSTPKANASVKLPEAYIIPIEWTEVIDRLALHKVRMMKLEKTVELPVETYRFSDYSWERTPYEGRLRMRLKSEPFRTTVSYPAGSVVVPMDQASARIIAWALEPMADGSFVKWGFFNAIFEQKEYGETYVMEKKAREMIARNPLLLEEFGKAKEENPNLAGNQWAQLNWFYSKTEYWDAKKDVYPVGRILDQEIVRKLIGVREE